MSDIQILAKALLELAKKATVTWDYDGETMHATGVVLDLEHELEHIASTFFAKGGEMNPRNVTFSSTELQAEWDAKDKRIAQLEAALRDCVEHMEWSTPEGADAWGKAKALVTAPETKVKSCTCDNEDPFKCKCMESETAACLCVCHGI